MRCCAALLHVVQPGVVLLCAVLSCFARLVPLIVVPCSLALLIPLRSFALRRCVLRCSPALCALCCVCFVVAGWCVLLFAAVRCAVCVLGCRAVHFLSFPLCAVLCCALLVCLRCAVLAVRAVAGAWCRGALLCVVLFHLVFCGAVLGLVARGCLLVAFFGVSVPVWPRGLLPCGWCGLLWCPAFLCRVLWCLAVAWCCAVVLCCHLAVLSVLALPSCGLSCGAVLCCAVLLVVCAGFLPVVASVCCRAPSLPAGMHKTHTLLPCVTPRLSLCWWITSLLKLGFVADPGVTAHWLHLFVHVQQPGPHQILVAALFGHVTAACSETEAEVSKESMGTKK